MDVREARVRLDKYSDALCVHTRTLNLSGMSNETIAALGRGATGEIEALTRESSELASAITKGLNEHSHYQAGRPKDVLELGEALQRLKRAVDKANDIKE